MDENRVVGTAKNIGGKVQEGFGRVMGDAKSQVEGATNQAATRRLPQAGQTKPSGHRRLNIKAAQLASSENAS